MQPNTDHVDLEKEAPAPLILWVSPGGELRIDTDLPSNGFWKATTIKEANAIRYDIWARGGRERYMHEPLVPRPMATPYR